MCASNVRSTSKPTISPVEKVDLRLEIGNELAVIEAEPDPLFDFAMGDQCSLHSRVEPYRSCNSSIARTVEARCRHGEGLRESSRSWRAPTRCRHKSTDLDDPLVEQQWPSDRSKRDFRKLFGARGLVRGDERLQPRDSSPLKRATTALSPSSARSAVAIDFKSQSPAS